MFLFIDNYYYMNLNIPTNLKKYCVSSYPDWYSNWLSTDILNRSKKSNDSFKSLQKFTVKSNNDDLNALDYIYRYNNIKLSILWNTSYLKEYDKNAKISIIVYKYINLSENGLINLIYQLYADSKVLKYKVLIKDFIDK